MNSSIRHVKPNLTNLLKRTSSQGIPAYIKNIKHLLTCKFTEILKNHLSPCATLQKALEYTILSNGKKLRAALICSSCKDINDDITEELILNSACAIELIHTYSIVHDDLPAMDDDDIRRGKPSCHKQFDEATAILVGDCLQTMAFNLLADSNTSPDKQLKIIKILSSSIGPQGMVAGQSLELSQEKYPNQIINNSEKIYKLNQIHHLKTGMLFTACFQIAAVINDLDQDPEQYQYLSTLGQKIGLAFQIQDDILDNTKTTSQLGKSSQSDAKRALPTYSNIMGLNEAKNILEELWQQCDELLSKLKLDTSTLRSLIFYIKTRQH